MHGSRRPSALHVADFYIWPTVLHAGDRCLSSSGGRKLDTCIFTMGHQADTRHNGLCLSFSACGDGTSGNTTLQAMSAHVAQDLCKVQS